MGLIKKHLRLLLSLFAIGCAFLPILDPIGIFTSLRNYSFDSLQRIYPRTVSEYDPVVIIDIDDQSLNQIGQWPWSRDVIAKLVGVTSPAASLTFDMVFAEPDRSSPALILNKLNLNEGTLNELQNIPDYDILLADAILNHGTVILGQAPNNKGIAPYLKPKFGLVVQGDNPNEFLAKFSSVQTNLSVLDEAAAGLGSMSIGNNDVIIRQLPSFELVGNNLIPGLALETARVAIGASTYQIKSSNASSEEAYGEKTGINNIKLGPLTIPTSANGNIWIYNTPTKNIRTISANDVLEGVYEDEFFEGKVLLVGTSASGLLDIRSTATEKNIPGVTVIAQLIQQIFADTFLQRPDWMNGAEFVAGLTLSIALALIIQSLGPASALFLYLLASGSILWITHYFFNTKLYLVDPISPLTISLLVYIVVTFFNFLFTELERSRVRSAFGQYLSPTMVNRLAESSESLKLGGEKKEMTFLFSDIRGFTKIAENYQGRPEELTTLINRLLGTLSEEILKEEGTIDKYMGDCIMAFWNAPTDQPDHANRALQAAKNMKKAMLELNKSFQEQGLDPINIGIGINTGSCVVGNMGSEKRFDYTVLGDAVNLASRLEGQSSAYGVDIVLGEKTAKELNQANLIELDLIAVKGKAEPIKIYTVLEDHSVDYDEIYELQNTMLGVYRNQRWDETANLLAEIGKKVPQLEIYTHQFAQRINKFKISPPSESWNGVYVAETK
jgi:adenylate cyclase